MGATIVLGFTNISAGLMESVITVWSIRWRARIYNGGESVVSADNPVERCHSQLPGRDYNFHNWYCTSGNMATLEVECILRYLSNKMKNFAVSHPCRMSQRDGLVGDSSNRDYHNFERKRAISEQQVCYAMHHRDLFREN